MAEYTNELRGVLFKNDKKETEKHPDYKGSCEIGGAEYWIAAWIKEGKNGKFMSLSFSLKEDSKKPEPRKESKKADPVEDETLPF
jgi:hypothetical protein